MFPVELECEYQSLPAVDKTSLRLSWRLSAQNRGAAQTACRVEVFSECGALWDSGVLPSRQPWLTTPVLSLRSSSDYRWRVTVWDESGKEAGSAESRFLTALLSPEEWRASWIEPRQVPVYHEEDIDMGRMFAMLKENGKIPFNYSHIYPCPMLRRDFSLREKPVSARLYATAHGLYRLELNGRRVGSEELTPGYTPYDKLTCYQTYDVTNLLERGDNAVGAVLADGWYAGRIGGSGDNCQYGDRLSFLMQLELTYPNGGREYILSDDRFTSSFGPLRYSDIFLGEQYDARLETPGWSSAGYTGRGWEPVTVTQGRFDNLAASGGTAVRVFSALPAREVIHTPAGETVIDFGQVMAGRVRMRVHGQAGDEVTLEHSEVLDEHGNFINNIFGRYKDQTDRYVLRGGGTEEYDPVFTFHGFRYVRLTGYPGEVRAEDFVAEALTSEMDRVGDFSCSAPDLNQLQHNILWSLLSNLLSVPTDCPQRERAGWTGDAQIIAPTACYDLDAAAFFRHYLRMMRLEQQPDGQVPIVIPFLPAYRKAAVMPLAPNVLPGNVTSAGWGDVCTILPWALYEAYGDPEILRENYVMMKTWLSYITSVAENYLPEGLGELTEERRENMKYLWNTNFHFGDWLAPSASIDPATGEVDVERSARLTNQYIPACFYALSADLVARSAAVLGYDGDAAHYRTLHSRICRAFAEEYVDERGRLPEELQGLYVLALQCGLVPEEKRALTAARLTQLIEANGNRLDTGFLSVPYLLDVLQSAGYPRKALELLYQRQCPSWLYEVDRGATTIWESWHGIRPDGVVGKDSYNHYAYGCVGDWMYRNLAGIRSDGPGYSHVTFRPQPENGLTWAASSHKTPRGVVSVRWDLTSRTFEAAVPAGAEGTVYLPGQHVTENGISVGQIEGVLTQREENGFTILEITSGTYCFRF